LGQYGAESRPTWIDVDSIRIFSVKVPDLRIVSAEMVVLYLTL
jgi:hypothetical protein